MTEFCPSLWPEVSVPHDEQDCQEYGLYQQGSRMVWGAVQSLFRDQAMDVKLSRGKMYDKYSCKNRRHPNLWKLFLEDWQQLAHYYHS